MQASLAVIGSLLTIAARLVGPAGAGFWLAWCSAQSFRSR
jgi:hypothetical protein